MGFPNAAQAQNNLNHSTIKSLSGESPSIDQVILTPLQRFSNNLSQLIEHELSAELSKTEECSCFKRWAIRYILLPIGKRWLPKAIDNATKSFVQTLMSLVRAETPFPTRSTNRGLQNMNRYFNILDGTLDKVAHQIDMHDTLDWHIEQELDRRLDPLVGGKEQLIKKSSQKIFNLLTQNLDAATFLSSQLPQMPRPCLVVCRTTIKWWLWSMGIVLWPLIQIAKFSSSYFRLENPFFSPKLEATLESAFLTPLQHMSCALIERILQHLKEDTGGQLSQAVQLDQQLLRTFIKQQYSLANKCQCSSQERLKDYLKGDPLKWVQNQLDDQFIIKEKAQVILQLIGAVWKTLTDRAFVSSQIEHLLLLANQELESPTFRLAPLDAQKRVDELIHFILHHKISTSLDQVDDKITTLLNSRNKESILNFLGTYFNLPDKTTIVDRCSSLGFDYAKQEAKKVEEFWNKPYNRRHGILYHQILLPLVT